MGEGVRILSWTLRSGQRKRVSWLWAILGWFMLPQWPSSESVDTSAKDIRIDK